MGKGFYITRLKMRFFFWLSLFIFFLTSRAEAEVYNPFITYYPVPTPTPKPYSAIIKHTPRRFSVDSVPTPTSTPTSTPTRTPTRTPTPTHTQNNPD